MPTIREAAALALILCLAPAPRASGAPSETAADRDAAAGRQWKEKLGLSAEQEAKFLAALRTADAELSPLRAQLRGDMRRVRTQLNENAPDKEIADTMQRLIRLKRTIAFRDDERAWTAWTNGTTGYPIVDAAMAQLETTGWMHNRLRMIVASFLCKHLLIDYRHGERYFEQRLADADLAANNGGWQWSASTGTDAAPYFRVFNPSLQGKTYDPHGTFVRRMLPVLATVPDRYVHEPWTMPPLIAAEAGCVIGRDYPEPIVDHAAARERALATLAAMKG